MRYSIHASITPISAAKLLLSNQIDLSNHWDIDEVTCVLNSLLTMPITDILQVIDCNPYGTVAETKSIPQFGKVSTLTAVPHYFFDTNKDSADYEQLGFYLKHDTTATAGSNTKFGENHGKCAALLGIVNLADHHVIPSSLSTAFCLFPSEQQEELTCRLLFRIPIVQIILKQAYFSEINGFSPMPQLKESTKIRRGQSLRAIFKTLHIFHSSALDNRISRIIWDK